MPSMHNSLLISYLRFINEWNRFCSSPSGPVSYIVWKILKAKVPNCGLKAVNSERMGRYCPLPNILKSRQKLISLKERSFQIWDPKLFNSMPKQLRNMTGCSADKFKMCLDKILELILDEPKTDSLNPRASSFTLQDHLTH